MKILAYTFRTFPYINQLKEIFPDLIVVGKVKEDLQKICELIKEENPEFIIGIALSKKESVFEPVAINKFNKGVVVKNQCPEFSLFIPQIKQFKISIKPSSSFCNYSMYKIKYFLNKNNLNIPLSFTHIRKENICELKKFS